MRKLILLFLLGAAFGQTRHTVPNLDTDNTFTGKNQFTKGAVLGPVKFADLGSLGAPQTGTAAIISDGSPGLVCAGGGTGIIAVYLNGAWNCSVSSGSAASFSSPPPLGNTTPNTVAGTVVNIVGSGLFFSAQPTCLFGESDNTLDEFEDVGGIPMWLPQGALGPCSQFLTYTPLPVGITPTDKQVPAWDAASGAFTIQAQAGGLPDPGSNGVIKRTALNTTAVSTSADIISLFSACSGVLYLGADGACHAAGASLGGSNTQIQFNNAGALGGISNAAIGSVLASKGTSTTPAFQSKMLIDVRDYGAIPDGSTDNATAIAAAFTAANAVSAGSPTVYFGCNGAGATCKYNYSGSGTSAINPTVPMTIACAPNTFLNYTGTTHAVDIGPSGLAAADSHLYTVKDCGFTGGASYTEGIFINNFITQVHFLNNYFLDFGNRTGATINCTGNCWLILLQSNFWFNDDNSNRNVLDAHLATNSFVFGTGNHLFCLTNLGGACAVTNPAYGIWARDAFLTGNQLGPGPQPVVRISSEAGGGGAGMYLVSNIIEGNTGSTTAAVEYGDPGATGNVHISNLHMLSNSIFWPTATNVDIMVTPQTPASSSYFLDASLITGNAITNSPTGTGKYFNFNLGSLNQFYGNYCGSTTVLCDQATANITETNGAKVDTWVIPYRQSNQSAGPQANYPVAMDASGPHYLSTATFHGLELPLQCSDSSGSGTAQTCNTNPKFDSTGTNLTPAAGDCIVYRTTTTNTGALTLNVNGTSAVGVQKRQGTVALAAGDLLLGHNTWLCYDGTNWDLLDPITQ